MTSLSAIGRLLWRPATWTLLFPLVLVSGLSLWDLPNGPIDLADAVGSGSSTPAVHVALWRLATLFNFSLAFFLSLVVRELQHTTFAWTLPDVSRRLWIGKLAGGVVAAAAVAALAAPVAGTEAGLDLFGWGFFCYSLGGMAFDPVLSKVESRAVPALIVAVAFYAAYIERLSEWQPLLFSAVAVGASLLLLRREFSSPLSRKRPLTAALTLSGTPGEYGLQQWARHSASTREWNASLGTDGIVAWLRAGNYEGYGGARGGFMGAVCINTAVATVVAYFTANPQMVVVLAWIPFSMRGIQLRTKFLYPFDRRRRATLFFASTLVESLAAIAVSMVAVLILFAIGLRSESPRYNSLAELAVFLISFLAWTPVGNWAKLRRPWVDNGSLPVRIAARFFGFQIAVIGLAGLSGVWLMRIRAASPVAGSLLAISLVAAVHLSYWFALRSHFRRRDLVIAP